MAHCYRCDICGKVDRTVVCAGDVVLIDKKGMSLHYSNHIDQDDIGCNVGDAGFLMRVRPANRVEAHKIAHMCWDCVKEIVRKNLENISRLLSSYMPTFSQFNAPQLVRGEYVGTGKMLTKEQTKALELLKPLLLGGE